MRRGRFAPLSIEQAGDHKPIVKVVRLVITSLLDR
jgi:hypothetical protein